MNLSTPDFAGRGQQALAAIFDDLVQDVQEQWRIQAATKPRDVAPPEPMLGEMGMLSS